MAKPACVEAQCNRVTCDLADVVCEAARTGSPPMIYVQGGCIWDWDTAQGTGDILSEPLFLLKPGLTAMQDV